jgi:hypothetical protein
MMMKKEVKERKQERKHRTRKIVLSVDELLSFFT